MVHQGYGVELINKPMHKPPRIIDAAFNDLRVAYLACQKSAEGAEQQSASSQKEAKAWYDTIESILQRIQVHEDEYVKWIIHNRKYHHK